MIKIVAASDNHGYLDPIEEILNCNSNADYYLHMGDCCDNPKTILPFVSVKGNNDYNLDLPDYRVIKIDDENSIFMIHGHQLYCDEDDLINEAKKHNCNIILYGHTHTFEDISKNGYRLINPGSCMYNRDRSEPSYAIITIDKGIINVKRINLDRLY